MGKKKRNKNRTIETRQETAQAGPLAALDASKRRALAIAACAALFIIGAMLRMTDMDVKYRSPDEIVITYQARAIAERGLQGIDFLIKEHKAQPSIWIYPSPVRIGHLLPLAAFMKVTGRTDEKMGAYMSMALSIATLALVAALGLRFLNAPITLFALAFLAVSPMDLAIARRTWQDSVLGFLCVGMIYCIAAISKNARAFFWYIVFVILGSWSILIKESGGVVYGLCGMWLIGALAAKKEYAKAVLVIALGAVGTLIGIGFLAYLSHGVAPFLEVLRDHMGAIARNEYAIEYQSCSWFRFIKGFWILSPLGATFCATGIVVTFFVGKRYPLLYGLVFFTVTLVIITMKTPYCMNYRYVSAMFAPFCLLAGTALWYCAAFVKDKLKGAASLAVIACLMLVVVIAAAVDYSAFQKMFVRTHVKDISIKIVEDVSALP